MPRPLRDSIHLYGLHDAGGEQVMLDLGVEGWVLVTEAVGSDPGDLSGRDYRRLSDRGLGVLVRLNAGYGGTGTLPRESDYAAFARRCANFARASEGAHLWIVGNEPNHPIEWPGADWDWAAQPPRPRTEDKRGEPITPERYARCYQAVRAAIRGLPGRGGDQVIVAAVAPWNALLQYPGNPKGDWVQYFREVLALIGAGNCDGISLHTYTHGSSPALIRSEARMGGDFRHCRYHFRAYRDFMAAIPAALRDLPVYITETDQGEEPWRNENTGWVREAYAEIDGWNRSSTQKIRSLILYRWPHVPGDRWGIEGKAGVIEDFRQALGARYRWDVAEDRLSVAQRRIGELELEQELLQPALQGLPGLASQAAELRQIADALGVSVARLEPAALRRKIDGLEAGAQQLEEQLGLAAQPPAAGPSQPLMQDRRGKLRAAAGGYPVRGAAIRRIIVHHTATRGDITPERLAEAQVGQGKPGITYHFLVTEDGTVYWTQPLEADIAQTTRAELNSDSVGIALAGNFTTGVPSNAQIKAAAGLIAWLLRQLHLSLSDVHGRRDLEPHASPGNQWRDGAAYRDTLLAEAQAILTAGGDDGQQVDKLNERIAILEAQVRDLAARAAQVPVLEKQVRDLQTAITDQQAEIKRLQDLLAASAGGRVAKPPIVDKVDKLDKHPTLPPYEKRKRAISTIVLHHTDTRTNITVEALAHYHVYGERKRPDGTVLKEQWPGVGYHFIIGADGVITQGQREETRSYHVGGEPNDYCVAISLIGRFMKTDLAGKPQPVEAQIPTPQQLASAGHLAAWLMQEYDVPLERVIGHRDVWPKATVCPGEHWKSNLKWHDLLVQEIKAVQQGGQARRIGHYLLFWDKGATWAQADWRGAQAYLEHFRTSAGFSVEDALHASNVTIVGSEAGVSAADEARLKAAGVTVRRLAGLDEAGTKALLDDLVQKNTLWPGATPRVQPARALPADIAIEAAEPYILDEWSVPDDWQPPAGVALPRVTGPLRVKVAPPAGEAPAD